MPIPRSLLRPAHGSGLRRFVVSSGRPLARSHEAPRASSSRRHGSCSAGAYAPLAMPAPPVPAAACGGLRSAPDHRTRRALLHLSYSCAPQITHVALVTHDPLRTYAGRRRLVKSGCDLGHEALHRVFDLRVRLQTDIEIEDDLIETGGLDLLQGVGDP